MRFLILIVAMMVLVSVGVAQPLGRTLPPKAMPMSTPAEVDPDVIRQGGDDWDQAFVIPQIPFQDSGTTVGYTANCCWEMCPYEAFGPAVFYRLTAPADMDLRIDLCGSDYDTGLYLFDVDLGMVACSIDYYLGDDPCGNYVSCIRRGEVVAGQDYYIVVTGFGGSSGNYVLTVTEDEDCIVDAPPGAMFEGEPTLVYDYVDAHNGGCNSPDQGSPFQTLVGDAQGELLFHGIGGWYEAPGFELYRDTDWFLATIGTTGQLDVSLVADTPTNLLELGPQDCGSVAVVQAAEASDCEEVSLQISGSPGEVVWLWVGSNRVTAPHWYDDTEYDYLLTISGLQPGAVATEHHSWSDVRALFR